VTISPADIRVTLSPADIMAEPIRHELKTHMTSTKELTTSAVGIGGEPSHARGLQVSEKVAAAILEETSSSIADMIEELSQAGSS